MSWISITIAGILTYLTRMTMVALVKREMLGDKLKDVLAYVPSAVFPAIIFPEGSPFDDFFKEYFDRDQRRSQRPKASPLGSSLLGVDILFIFTVPSKTNDDESKEFVNET